MQPHIVKAFDAEIHNFNEKITTMAKACEEQLSLAAKAFDSMDVDLVAKIVKSDTSINRSQIDIEESLVRILARRQPMAGDLKYLLSVIKIASELERIGDYAANIAKRVKRLPNAPSREPANLISEMAGICLIMIRDVMVAFLAQDVEKAAAVWQKDNDVDRKFARMMTMVRTRMQEDKDAIDESTQLIFIARCYERIGDHITNIAENIQYMSLGPNQSDRF